MLQTGIFRFLVFVSISRVHRKFHGHVTVFSCPFFPAPGLILLKFVHISVHIYAANIVDIGRTLVFTEFVKKRRKSADRQKIIIIILSVMFQGCFDHV